FIVDLVALFERLGDPIPVAFWNGRFKYEIVRAWAQPFDRRCGAPQIGAIVRLLRMKPDYGSVKQRAERNAARIIGREQHQCRLLSDVLVGRLHVERKTGYRIASLD